MNPSVHFRLDPSCILGRMTCNDIQGTMTQVEPSSAQLISYLVLSRPVRADMTNHFIACKFCSDNSNVS